VGFNMSVRPVIAETERAAWDKARRILAGMAGKLGWARQEGDGAREPVDNAGRRQFAFAQEKDVHDERLWMGITRATGALGNISCLVGTAEQVANAVLEYYRLGVSSFLMRGFDPVADTTEFGRELIPRIKAGALELDGASRNARDDAREAAGGDP
jgi:alkanesulfonate monooxygenase